SRTDCRRAGRSGWSGPVSWARQAAWVQASMSPRYLGWRVLSTGRVGGAASAAGVAALAAPDHLALAGYPRQHAGQDEQQVRQPVEEAHGLATHRFDPRQGDRLAFGAAHDGAGQVAARRGLAAGREDEIFQRRQGLVVV